MALHAAVQQEERIAAKRVDVPVPPVMEEIANVTAEIEAEAVMKSCVAATDFALVVHMWAGEGDMERMLVARLAWIIM